MKRIFVTGASSGIGAACYNLLSKSYDVFAPTRAEYNLENFDQVDSYNLSSFDIIVNCAGNNVGTYLGFHDNSWCNQVSQINVNFIGPLLMAKRYTLDRSTGHFIYISSISANNPEPYNVVSATSKNALNLSMLTLSKKFTGIRFTEICPGRTRTNMLHQNYAGSKSFDEIEKEYDLLDCLDPTQVANSVLYSILNPIKQLTITP